VVGILEGRVGRKRRTDIPEDRGNTSRATLTKNIIRGGHHQDLQHRMQRTSELKLPLNIIFGHLFVFIESYNQQMEAASKWGNVYNTLKADMTDNNVEKGKKIKDAINVYVLQKYYSLKELEYIIGLLGHLEE
jgi:hypothetical protein